MIRIGRRGAPPPRLHSWRSLVRTARAPIGILVLASIGLVLPKQTADELNALSDMQAQPMLLPGVVLLQASLGLLALSAWYWAKAAFSARFGADDSLETRPGMETADRAAFEAVPRIVFLGGVLLAAFLLWRGFSWVQALSVAVWGVPAYILIRWHAPVCTRALERRARLHRLRSTSNLRVWPLVATGRVRALLILAPFGSRVSVPLLIAGILPFVWGAIEGYVRLWPSYPGLPAYAAQVFPGPSVALIGLALLIAPFSALIIAADGFRMETVILSSLTGFARPPVMTCLVVWTAAAPLLFSLHTVRTVEPSRQVVAAAARAPLDAFLADWIKACGQNQDAVLHPIVVAVSGGASRAGIWGARACRGASGGSRGAQCRRVRRQQRLRRIARRGGLPRGDAGCAAALRAGVGRGVHDAGEAGYAAARRRRPRPLAGRRAAQRHAPRPVRAGGGDGARRLRPVAARRRSGRGAGACIRAFVACRSRRGPECRGSARVFRAVPVVVLRRQASPSARHADLDHERNRRDQRRSRVDGAVRQPRRRRLAVPRRDRRDRAAGCRRADFHCHQQQRALRLSRAR